MHTNYASEKCWWLLQLQKIVFISFIINKGLFWVNALLKSSQMFCFRVCDYTRKYVIFSIFRNKCCTSCFICHYNQILVIGLEFQLLIIYLYIWNEKYQKFKNHIFEEGTYIFEGQLIMKWKSEYCNYFCDGLIHVSK